MDLLNHQKPTVKIWSCRKIWSCKKSAKKLTRSTWRFRRVPERKPLAFPRWRFEKCRSRWIFSKILKGNTPNLHNFFWEVSIISPSNKKGFLLSEDSWRAGFCFVHQKKKKTDPGICSKKYLPKTTKDPNHLVLWMNKNSSLQPLKKQRFSMVQYSLDLWLPTWEALPIPCITHCKCDMHSKRHSSSMLYGSWPNR